MGPLDHGSDTETQHRAVVFGGGTMAIGDGNSLSDDETLRIIDDVMEELENSSQGSTSAASSTVNK